MSKNIPSIIQYANISYVICHMCQNVLYKTEPDNMNFHPYIECSKDHLYIQYNDEEEIISYDILYVEDDKEYIIISNKFETVVYEELLSHITNTNAIHSNNDGVVFLIDIFCPLPIKNNIIQAHDLFDKIKLLNTLS